MSETTPSPQSGPSAYSIGQRESLTSPCRFLSRQPVLDGESNLFGYELFVRPGDTEDCDPELATREAVDHWLMLAPESRQGCAFIPSTPAALIEGLVTLLPAGSTVFAIDASAHPNPGFLPSCLILKQQGYRFAVDALVPTRDTAPFLQLADFIRIDFQAADFADRAATYALAAGTSVQVLARNIETDIQMRIARSEGCSLFQGSFFSQPVLVSSGPIPRNHLVYLHLLGALHEVPTDLRKVERFISGDASLCYRVLRLANSAMQGHPNPVNTIREALMMAGEEAIRKMATVAVAGALAGERSATLVSMALSRAHFCELLASAVREPAAQMYLLGMVSMLDVLLETPLRDILHTLPISPAMKAALAGDDSGPGRILLLVRSLESCDWQRCLEIQRLLGLQEGFIASTYVNALREASALMQELFFAS
ncbi:MAG TPA: HDOD domain-containing protein [Acidobacteriaceae bacterium]|jgi:EAL and modified HD-GYP domain-containing signal transduction protein|nr:HDOD domain-containing protein [Acidobacteriaceae bacterium]